MFSSIPNASSAHAGSLILAEVMSKLRGIGDAYKRILTNGSSSFLPPDTSSSPSPSSHGFAILQHVLTTWDDIDRAISLLPHDQEASLLRPYVVGIYNECRSVQGLLQPRDVQPTIALLQGRQRACSLLTTISMPSSKYSTVSASSSSSSSSASSYSASTSTAIPMSIVNALAEAVRCWARTAIAWERVINTLQQQEHPHKDEQSIVRIGIRECYAGALIAHSASGGTNVVARLLMGLELETHIQAVFDCVTGLSRALWNSIMNQYDTSFSDGNNALVSLTTENIINNNNSSNSPLLVDEEERLFHLLTTETSLFLAAHLLPHERMNVARMQAQVGRYYLDHNNFLKAEKWLEAALGTTRPLVSTPPPTTTTSSSSLLSSSAITTTTTTTPLPPSDTASPSSSHVLAHQLLLCLAACTVERMTLNKTEGRDESAKEKEASNTINVAAASRVISLINEANGVDTIVGRHLLVKLACVRGNVDEAGEHLSILLSLPPSTQHSNDDASSSENASSLCTIGGVQVHPDFPLIASALRVHAVLRHFDVTAMKAYGTAGAKRFSTAPETVLLRHDLLKSLLAEMANQMKPSSSSSSSLSLLSSSSAVSLPHSYDSAHLALADARCHWALKRIVDDHLNNVSHMPLHVYESVTAILKGGLRSAFEAGAWDTAVEFAQQLLSLYETPASNVAEKKSSKVAADPDASSTSSSSSMSSSSSSLSAIALSYLYKVLAISLVHTGEYRKGLDAARKAFAMQDCSITRFVVFRVLASMPVEMIKEFSAYAQELVEAFNNIVKSADFTPIHLVAATELLLSNGGDINLSAPSSPSSSSSSLLSTLPLEKLAVTATALKKLLLASPGYDPTIHHRSLKTAVLTRTTLMIHDQLFRNQGRNMNLTTDTSTPSPLSSSSHAHLHQSLRLLYICVESLSRCKNVRDSSHGTSSSLSSTSTSSHPASLAFVNEVKRSWGNEEDLRWGLRTAWNLCTEARLAQNICACLAAAYAIEVFAAARTEILENGIISGAAEAVAAEGVVSNDDHDSKADSSTTTSSNIKTTSSSSLPPQLVAAVGIRNMLEVIISARMIQARCHIMLASPPLSSSSSSPAASSSSFASHSQHPLLLQQVAGEAIGPDACADISLQTSMQHIQAALKAIENCRAAYRDLAAKDAMVAATCMSSSFSSSRNDVFPLGNQDPLFEQDADLLQQIAALTSLFLKELSGGNNVDRSVYANNHSNNNATSSATITNTSATSASSTSFSTGLPSILAVLEFHARVLRHDTTASLIHFIHSFSAVQGMNAYMLEHISEVARQPPCSDRAVALASLRMATGMALRSSSSLSSSSSAAAATTTTTPSMKYIATLLRQMIMLAPTRSESLPMFEELRRVLLSSFDATSTTDDENRKRRSMYPVDEADYATVLAWNHGCFFYRMNALEHAEKFMNFAISMIPLVARCEKEVSLRGKVEIEVIGSGAVSSSSSSSSSSPITSHSSITVTLMSGNEMRQQHEHVRSLLRTGVGAIANSMRSTSISLEKVLRAPETVSAAEALTMHTTPTSTTSSTTTTTSSASSTFALAVSSVQQPPAPPLATATVIEPSETRDHKRRLEPEQDEAETLKSSATSSTTNIIATLATRGGNDDDTDKCESHHTGKRRARAEHDMVSSSSVTPVGASSSIAETSNAVPRVHRSRGWQHVVTLSLDDASAHTSTATAAMKMKKNSNDDDAAAAVDDDVVWPAASLQGIASRFEAETVGVNVTDLSSHVMDDEVVEKQQKGDGNDGAVNNTSTEVDTNDQDASHIASILHQMSCNTNASSSPSDK